MGESKLTAQDLETARQQLMVLRKLWEDALRSFLLSRRSEARGSSDEHRNFLDELKALDQIRARYKGGVVSPEFLSFKSMEQYPTKTAADEEWDRAFIRKKEPEASGKDSLFRRLLHHPATTALAAAPAAANLAYDIGTLGHHLLKPGPDTLGRRLGNLPEGPSYSRTFAAMLPALGVVGARALWPKEVEKKAMNLTDIFANELNKIAAQTFRALGVVNPGSRMDLAKALKNIRAGKGFLEGLPAGREGLRDIVSTSKKMFSKAGPKTTQAISEGRFPGPTTSPGELAHAENLRREMVDELAAKYPKIRGQILG
jgi:hypothetical protein